MKGAGKIKVKLSVPAGLKGPRQAKPGPSHPRFKRPKMSVMGHSAYGTGGKKAFPASAMGDGAAMLGGGAGGGAAPMPPGAPMPPNAAPDNITG